MNQLLLLADQVAADRDPAARLTGGEHDAISESLRAERLEGKIERTATGRARARTAGERVELALARDETARLRDLSAAARDWAAELSDLADTRIERERGLPDSNAEAMWEWALGVRAAAAAGRARAAADREQAAADRVAAAQDREQAKEELRHAQLDALTGAYGRELGSVALEHEINRARHSNEPLVLACLDVDGLKLVNDGYGHAAGDALLRAVVDAIQSYLRSYDPIVRVGGDEFICALADCTLEEARRRFQAIRVTLEQTQPDASISVGFAQLGPQDTLEQLTARGDFALYETKHTDNSPKHATASRAIWRLESRFCSKTIMGASALPGG